MIKTVFFGTPEFASQSFEYLIEQGIIPEAIVTVPDKPQGRNKKIQPSAVKTLAERYSIPCFQPEKLKNNEFIHSLREINADLFVVVAFKILPQTVLAIPGKGAINLHASYLPEYRGASPIQTVILNDEEYTGVTTFFLNKEIDGGDILCRKKIKILDKYNAGMLYDILLQEGKELLRKTIIDIDHNQIQPIPQPKEFQHYASKFSKEDTRIQWNKDVRTVFNQIRAFSPYPGAFTNYQNQLLKFYASEIIDPENQGNPGKITISKSRKELIVETMKGSLKITEIQASGKKKMKTEEFLKGFSIQDSAFFS